MRRWYRQRYASYAFTQHFRVYLRSRDFVGQTRISLRAIQIQVVRRPFPCLNAVSVAFQKYARCLSNNSLCLINFRHPSASVLPSFKVCMCCLSPSMDVIFWSTTYH